MGPTRKSMRYPVKARVSFWWKDEDGNQRQGEGTSRDISETGTFVVAPACPPLGADVELRIFLPALPNVTSALRMQLAGRVLRVEQTAAGKGSSGFAVLTKDAILRENDESTGEGNSGGNEAK
ncbi:MAG: PilZ domain-containing protein [Candidatus Acidiferrales bacterium]